MHHCSPTRRNTYKLLVQWHALFSYSKQKCLKNVYQITCLIVHDPPSANWRQCMSARTQMHAGGYGMEAHIFKKMQAISWCASKLFGHCMLGNSVTCEGAGWRFQGLGLRASPRWSSFLVAQGSAAPWLWCNVFTIKHGFVLALETCCSVPLLCAHLSKLLEHSSLSGFRSRRMIRKQTHRACPHLSLSDIPIGYSGPRTNQLRGAKGRARGRVLGSCIVGRSLGCPRRDA